MAINSNRQAAIVRIITGLWILWGFGWDTVGRRLNTDVDGVVISSRDFPSTGAPRYATEYNVRRADGMEKVFWAGPTDGSLARSMPVGTRIKKFKWHLEYERDGQHISFPIIFYSIILGIGFGALIWGIIMLLSQNKAGITESHLTNG